MGERKRLEGVRSDLGAGRRGVGEVKNVVVDTWPEAAKT